MKNRIIITTKINDLLSDIEGPRPNMKRLSFSQEVSMESKIINHLKVRLDEDAVKTKFVQEKTKSLALKIKQMQEQSTFKKVQLPQELIESMQENLIQQQETRINKILKRQQQYEEQNKSAQLFRIRVLEKQQQELEQKHTQLPEDFKSFYQPIEEASTKFINMDQRMKVQLENRAKRKFYSFWSHLHTPQKVQVVNKSQSYFFQPQKKPNKQTYHIKIIQ